MYIHSEIASTVKVVLPIQNLILEIQLDYVIFNTRAVKNLQYKYMNTRARFYLLVMEPNKIKNQTTSIMGLMGLKS